MITQEFELAKKYLIKTEIGTNGISIAQLTIDNVARTEAMFQTDSSYKKTVDKNAKPIKYPKKQTDEFKYGGSTAYWMNQLKDVLIDNQPVSRDNYTFGEIIKYAVNAVDRENSTHLNSDGVGREEITDRIISLKSEILQLLSNPQENDYKIVKEISKKTTRAKKQRQNPSFASKFAHYASFYLFEGTEKQDNFSIYDGVLKEALPFYFSFYNIKDFDLSGDYYAYQKAIDELRDCAAKKYGETISRNGLDHLVWYYHK